MTNNKQKLHLLLAEACKLHERSPWQRRTRARDRAFIIQNHYDIETFAVVAFYHLLNIGHGVHDCYMTAPCTPSYIDSCSFCLLTVSNKPSQTVCRHFWRERSLVTEPHSSPYVLFNSWTQRDRLISMIHFHINSIHLCYVIEILMRTCNTQTPNGILTIPNKPNQLYSNDTVLMAFLRGNVYWIFNEFYFFP